MVDVLLVLILIAVGYRTKVGFNKDYLSKESTTYIKGICCLLIIIHHIAQLTTTGFLLRGFSEIGFVVTGIFYFISGYGVMTQYASKRDTYLHSFFRKRILKVFVVWILASIVYGILAYVINGDKFSLVQIKELAVGKVYLPYSWYIVSITVFYIFIFIAAKIAGKKDIVLISILFILIFLYIEILGRKLYFSINWFESSYAFLLGVVWATFGNRLTEKIRKYKILYFSVIALALIGIYIRCRLNSSYRAYELLMNIVVILIVMLILGILLYLKSDNPILFILGKYSTYLYLYQGIALRLVKYKNDISYIIVGTVVLPVCVIIICKIIEKIKGKILNK